MATKNKLLIYGAAGYTGTMISERAKELNLDFEIAGREKDKIKALAETLNVLYHVFTVDDEAAWQKALANKQCLINAAGPFRYTAEQAMKACLQAGVHYLDISAELETYQLAESLDQKAKGADIQLISGAGLFVSYDALAIYVAGKVRNPQKLSVGFRHFGGFSRGSVISSQNIADLGVLVRRDGEIVTDTEAKPKTFRFVNEEEECLPTPLGGIIISYKSTGIPNIEEYFSLKLPAAYLPDLYPATLPDGPTAEERAAGRNALSAEVIGENGEVFRAVMDTPSGYTFTPLAVVAVANRILNNDFKIGYQSPASAYGVSIINEIPDIRIIDL